MVINMGGDENTIGKKRPEMESGLVDLRRDSLLDRIQSSSAQLILAQAPAGYGKSSLLRQLAAAEVEAGGSVGWITPVSQDGDLSRFVQMFIGTCERLIEDTGGKLRRTTRDISALISAINGPALLLLDEYDQFAHGQADALLGQIIEQLPPGKRIAVATRTMPDLSSARLKLSGRAIVLGSIDLRFDLGESYQFLSERCRLGLDEVRELHSRIDGWPAALQFINLSLASHKQGAAKVLRSGMTQELVDYLAQEVFHLQTAETRKALLGICLADRLCAELVNHKLGGTEGGALLDRLSDGGLFLDPVDGDWHWFRFHPLFGDFLRTRVQQENSPDALTERHVRIADWFAAQDMREVAISHYLAAGRQESAAACLEEVAEQLVREERLGLLVSLFEQLDQQVLLSSPKLLDAAVIAYGFRRQFAKAHRLLNHCESSLAQSEDDPVAAAELEVRRCFVLAAEDRVVEMGERARDAEKWLDDDQPFSKAVAFNAHAFLLGAQSQFPEAHELLLRARPLHEKARNYFGRSYANAIHASLKISQGLLGEAIDDLRRALRELDVEGPGGIMAGGVVAAPLGEALYERNEIDEAERVITDYLPLIQQQSIVDPLCSGVVTLARIATLKGRPEYAHELYEYLIDSGHKYGLSRLVDCGRAELVREAVLQGDISTAERRFGALGAEARLPTEGQLIYSSGELEVQRITYIRLLVHKGAHAEARAMLQSEIRTATVKHRVRRLIRLKTLLAISLEMDGQLGHARRVMMEAVALAAPARMHRIFLDEGPAAIRMLNHLASENFTHDPDWAVDDVARYVKLLVKAAEGGAQDEGAIPVLGEEEAAALARPHENLTPREIDILHFLAKGHSNKDLADRLAVSQNTVKFHLRNVFAKLDVGNRMQAVQAARHFKLIE